jgi:hypothetical protein
MFLFATAPGFQCLHNLDLNEVDAMLMLAKIFTRFTRKGFQSKRATVSLLIKKKQLIQKKWGLLLLWCKKIVTSCACASENKDSYLLRRDTVMGCVQRKIARCSSWTSSSASHR